MFLDPNEKRRRVLGVLSNVFFTARWRATSFARQCRASKIVKNKCPQMKSFHWECIPRVTSSAQKQQFKLSFDNIET